jgi:hypothetical protein
LTRIVNIADWDNNKGSEGGGRRGRIERDKHEGDERGRRAFTNQKMPMPPLFGSFQRYGVDLARSKKRR